MAEIAALGLKVDGIQNVDSASDSLDRFTSSGEKAEKATRKVGDESSKAAPKVREVGKTGNESATGLSKMASAAKTAGLALGALAAATALKNYADKWSDMRSSVGAAIGNMNQANAAMARLVDIANASYSPLEQTAAVYARNVSTFKDLGRNATQAADFTESLNHALVTTATKGQDADVVINALSRSLATGKLDALAFDTIVSRSPRVLQAMADEMGVTTSAMRAMAVDGKITSDVIANGLINSLERLREEAGEMPATLGDAFTRIQNNLTELVGRFDKASGASSAMAELILKFADGIRTAGGYLVTFGNAIAPVVSLLASVASHADIAVVALAGFYAPALIGGIATLSTGLGVGLVGAIRAVTAAMMANPIGLLVGALSAALYAAWQFSEGFRKFIVDDVGQYVKTGANFLVNSFIASYEDIKYVWNNFGTMMGAAVVGGVNLAIRAINGLIEGATSGIDNLIGKINNALGTDIGRLGSSLGISELENKFSSDLSKATQERNAKISEIMGRDTVGGWFSSPEGSAAPDAFGGGGVAGGAAATGAAGGSAAKQMSEAAKAAEQNAQAINKLGESLYLAGLKGEELAIAQARLSLNEYATPEQIAQIDALASAIYKVQETAKQREKFGEGNEADKYILGDRSPLSGGAFDDQFARYEAEAEAERERYQQQQERLIEARELQIETMRSYDDLEAQAAQEHADRMNQIERAKSQVMLTTFSSAFGAIAEVMKNAHGEQSGIYRAMFAASKAFAVANATVNAYDAISKAWASAPFPANLMAVAATAPQVMAVVSAVSGTGLSGMAHDGIDSIPQTGTWLLEKGERVTTANTSAKMDSTLERVDQQLRASRSSGGTTMQAPPVINVIEDSSRAGTQEVTQNQDGSYSTSVFVANIFNGGDEATALERTYGLQRVGR